MDGEPFFGFDIPRPEGGYVRMRIDRGFHYFQYLGDNKTRYVTIFNADPNIAYLPDWAVNFTVTKFCYE
jgi:hypothetical protein